MGALAALRSIARLLREMHDRSASVPFDADESAARLGWTPADRSVRLRLVCDEYMLDRSGPARVLECLDESIARGGEFVRRRVEAGEAAFIEMWEVMGGQERFDRRRRWWADARVGFERACSR